MRRAWLVLIALLVACGDDSVSCGVGTTNRNGVCVPAVSSCGAGTLLVGDTCVPADAPFEDAADAAVGPSCGPGTHQVGNLCFPDTGTSGFEVRMAQNPITAYGYTKVAV